MQPEPTDDDLLRLVGKGDEHAFTAIYRRHQSRVFRFALQMSGKPDLAEDVTQEVFMMLMRGKSRYDPDKGSLASFLYGVARRILMRALERERQYSTGLDETDSDPPSSGDDVLGDLTRTETLEALRQGILSLPPLYREVVVLCELHELDYAGAAEVLKCPVGTVRSRLHRARALLTWKLRTVDRCPA